MRNIDSCNKIYVIGTGFSSLICVLYLISKKIKPVVIDIASNYSEKNYKLPLLKPYFYKQKVDSYSFFGGLSNIWKGVIQICTKKEFNELNLKKPELLLNEVLNLTKNMYFFTNEEIRKNKFKLLPIKDLKNPYKRFGKEVTNFKKPIILSSKKNKCEPYKTSIIFKKLLKKKKIGFVKGKVVSVQQENRKTILVYRKENEIKKVVCKHIFCGAGALSSTTIINNSLKINKKPTFKSNSKYLLFSFYKNKKIIDNTFPIYQGKILNNGYTKVYVQSYLFSQLINQSLKRWKITYKFISNLPVMNKLAVSYVSTNFKDHKNTNLLNLSKEINRSQNLFNSIPVGIKLAKLAGNHFGSSFKTNIKGNIEKIKNFSLIDTSNLNKINCTPPSIILFMHSLNITKNVFKDLKK